MKRKLLLEEIPKASRLHYYFVMKWMILFLILSLHVAADSCKDFYSFAHPSEVETWAQLYKKSDLSPRPALWLKIRQSLNKHVTHIQNPLGMAGSDPNRLGAVYKSMISELPILATLIEKNRIQRLSHADFIKLKRLTANQIISVSVKPNSDLQVFASLEALKYISAIESRVEFPKTSEDIEKENKKNEIDKKKKQEKQEKEKKNDQEEEQEPEWNDLGDKYRPENKDLSSDSGGKKKNADILMTDADVSKRLLRQRIFDDFDIYSSDWSSIPVFREKLGFERKPSKKIIIDNLGKAEIKIPVPYGYTLVPGKFSNGNIQYGIKEIGVGEFALITNSKTPVTLGLHKITQESHISRVTKRLTPDELSKWPKHLLTFTESLRDLSPLDAAAKLEQYISSDGGFLYYSKGDKIDAQELSKIDKKMNSLMSHMPKPMAMANVGAFNCDGAAWIGALLLRDVLGHQVRIAGGRTSSGTTSEELISRDGFQFKNPHRDQFHVVRSADPAHAWIEVYDGKNWTPFDMTPKHNTPDSESAPTDLDRETPKPSPQPQDQQKPKSEDKDRDSDRKDPKSQAEDTKKDQGKGQTSEKESDEHGDKETRRIEDIIKAKSTQRQKDEAHLALIDRILKKNELILLEHLIYDGYQTKFSEESVQLLQGLKEHPLWKNSVERSFQKISGFLHESKFAKFNGLNLLVNEVRVDFGQNQARNAKQKLMLTERLLLALAEYRSLTQAEVEALGTIQKISSILDRIKHKNSKEFDVVDELLKNLPGNLSKDWLKKEYGNDFDQLGTTANLNLAEHLVSGKLKPLLQMGAVSEFVNMTLNSTQDPQWKDESTLNRSLVPKPRQDLIVTRNPLDFAKMLWNLRPGENMFAPTFQGRQFAIGSLETRKVPNPKNPIEKKVSVVYYDVSSSMKNNLNGGPIETQDALLMAFVDRALSETDALGRPLHEVYLIPFGNKRYEGVHISSREDALNFISKMMNFRTNAPDGNAYTEFVEEFYELVASSYATKSQQGREKLFQKANMVLFTDGIYDVDINSIEQARKKLPPEVEINLNFVSIGDQVNENLHAVATNSKISSKKPSFRQLNSQMINSVVSVSAKYVSEAFATKENLSGRALSEINELLKKINIDPRQQGSKDQTDKTLAQIQITKSDVTKLSGLREILNLQRLVTIMDDVNMSQISKQRIVSSIVEAYPQLTGRSWKDMTYDEKEALDELNRWSNQ